MHLDSTFLGVHLDSKAVQEQQRSTGYGSSRKTASCGTLGAHEQGGTGTEEVDWAWTSRKNSSSSAKPGPGQQAVVKLRLERRSCRRCRSRGNNALLAEISLLIYSGAGS